MRQSPYMDGKGDIVKDFVASARAKGVSPCFYIIPGWDSYESRSGKVRQEVGPTVHVLGNQNVLARDLTHCGTHAAATAGQ